MQNAGKRKVLRFEEEMVVTTEGEVESSSDQQQQDGDKEPAVPHVEGISMITMVVNHTIRTFPDSLFFLKQM